MMANDIMRRWITALSTFEEYIVNGWEWVWWVNIPGITLLSNVAAVVLTGAGHAPLVFYVPLLLLSGPLLLLGAFVPIDDTYWRDRWIGWLNLFLVVGPAFLSLVYMFVTWLLASGRRRSVFRGIVLLHIGSAIAVFCWRTFVKL
jgi:hypothetical protein